MNFVIVCLKFLGASKLESTNKYEEGKWEMLNLQYIITVACIDEYLLLTDLLIRISSIKLVKTLFWIQNIPFSKVQAGWTFFTFSWFWQCWETKLQLQSYYYSHKDHLLNQKKHYFYLISLKTSPPDESALYELDRI